METLDLLEGAYAFAGGHVAAVTPNDLDTRTPCDQWDVRGLLKHMTGVVARFGATAARTKPDFADDHDFVGADPKATFDQAAKATLHAWSQPGALDGTCTLAMGLELPAQQAARINFIDTLVHGWDLARALGRDATIDPELAAAALEASRSIVNSGFRGSSGAFGPEVDVGDDASPTDKLVAFLGRQP